MLGYQTTTAILSLTATILILWMIRKDHLHPKKAAGWVAIAIGIGVLGFFPTLVDRVSVMLGVSYAPTLVLTIGILLLCLKLLRLDAQLSQEERKVKVLIQKVAVLESRLEKEQSSE